MSYAEAIAEFVQAAAAAGIAVELGDPEGAEAELCATVLGDQLAAEIVATGYPGGCEIPWVAEELYIYSLTELRERQAGYRTDARTGVDQDDWDADRWVIADWTADPVSINGTGVIAYARHGQDRWVHQRIARDLPSFLSMLAAWIRFFMIERSGNLFDENFEIDEATRQQVREKVLASIDEADQDAALGFLLD